MAIALLATAVHGRLLAAIRLLSRSLLVFPASPTGAASFNRHKLLVDDLLKLSGKNHAENSFAEVRESLFRQARPLAAGA